MDAILSTDERTGGQGESNIPRFNFVKRGGGGGGGGGSSWHEIKMLSELPVLRANHR